MTLYAVVRTYYIEDYYCVSNISSIHETELAANEYITGILMSKFYDNYEAWLNHHAFYKARDENTDQLNKFKVQRDELAKPRYNGAPNDKEALARHHQLKAEWNSALDDINRNESLFNSLVIGPCSDKIVEQLRQISLTSENYNEIIKWRSYNDDNYKVVPIETGVDLGDYGL